MIDILEKIAILPNHICSLKEMSKDGKVYMVEFQDLGVNFDEIAKCYKKEFGLSETPCSNDGLMWEDSGRIYFIEFKNGNMKDEVSKVKTKIYDSNLMLMELATITLQDIRQNVDYILVYNETKGVEFLQQQKEKSKKKISNSPSVRKIANAIYSHSEKELILFGLDKFQNYCFKTVHTYTVSQFEEYMKKGT